MAAETIRSFLVSLGFKTDEPTLKKFQDSIQTATFKAKLLADGIEGAAKAIVEHIRGVAKDLSNLYFASVRIGTSASSLKALTQASQDFGVSAEEAVGNMEALAQILRTNPGKEAYLNNLGVKTRQANGELRDTQDIMNDLGPVLAKFPGFLQQRFADLFGMTYKFRRMITDPGFQQDLEKHKKLLGEGYDEAARKATELTQRMREFQDRWDGLKTRMEGRLFGPLLDEAEKVDQWFGQHEEQIEHFMETMIKVVELTARIVIGITKQTIAGLEAIYSGFEKTGKRIEEALPRSLQDSIGAAMHWLIDEAPADTIIGGIRDAFRKPAATGKPSNSASFGLAIHNPGNLKYAGQPGAIRAGGSPEQRQFASFGTDQEGLRALARQLELDFGRGRTNITSLLSKYAPAGDNDLPAYIAAVSQQMHRGANASLDLHDPAVLTAMMNAIIQHEHNANPYSAAMVRGAADSAVLGGNVTVHQSVQVRIDGSKDPAATKQVVLETLSDINRRAVRSLQPTTQ